jgi:CheY-like chemotaxis protein
MADHVHRRPLRIIVADDERDTVLTLRALLGDEGHEVTGVYSASGVMAELSKQIPDALIVDINMPGVSGYEVAREAKRICGDWAPLMIAISGKWVGQTDKMLSHLAGFNHFLEKPCNVAALLNFLEPLRSQPAAARAPFLDDTAAPPDAGLTPGSD